MDIGIKRYHIVHMIRVNHLFPTNKILLFLTQTYNFIWTHISNDSPTLPF